MSVLSVLIALQASCTDGRGVTSAGFIEPLQIEPGEVEDAVADRGQWASGMVYFAVVWQSDFDDVDVSVDGGAQSEAFFHGIIKAFRATGKFFDRRPTSVTALMRATGLSLRMFVEIRMDQDQMELELPPEFLAACGRHGIGIYLISNDIPAAEVLASQEA